MASRKGPLCACVEHGIICNTEQPRIIKFSSKKIKVATITFMKEEGLLPLHAAAICEDCRGHAERMMSVGSKRLKRDHCSFTIEQIKDGQIETDKLEQIAIAIGSRLSRDILQDVNQCAGTYKEDEIYDTFSVKNWLENRNSTLIKFLMSCANIENLDNRKSNLCIMGAIDSIYKARVQNIITPLPFFKNLVSFYISGSSYITRLNCAYSPAGSYSSLKSWLKEQSKQPIITNTNGNDCITFFDNNQVVARNWRVNYNHKSKASVVTMIINITPFENNNLQMNDSYSPRQWLYNASNDGALHTNISSNVREADAYYDRVRNEFVSKRLASLSACHTETESGQFIDDIDRYINDNNDINLTPSTHNPYSWVRNGHAEHPPTVSVVEPSMANPCSFESVSKVLTHIQQQSADKTWLAVGCDGLPYTLGHKLIPKNDQLKNILLLPGNGHVEMNSTKALFKILWGVVLEELAKLNGFRTPRALLAARNCSDHHKSWALLMTFLFGTLDELMVPYIVSCKIDKVEPDLKGFYLYIQKSKSPNYRFMADIVLNYVLALFVFRCGVRRAKHEYIESGRSKVMKLFFGVGMTNYQFLTFCDLKVRALAPPEVREFIRKTESFSVSGNDSKGEGGDFILEAFNARTKRWLPPGVPKEKHWKQVCRNVEKMEKIRDKLHEQVGIKKKEAVLYQRDISKEIFQWRVKIRQTKYLNNKDNANMPHTSISGNDLDKGLISFESVLNENFNTYLNCLTRGHQPGKVVKLTPIFTTAMDGDHFHDIR